MAATALEPVIPLPARIEPATSVRSTLILSSIAAIREFGYADRYFAALPAVHHPRVKEAVAGTWLPIEIAVAHYGACDALGLPVDVQFDLGRSVGEKVRGTLLGTVVRMAKEAGVTPLTVIAQFPRFWSRAFEGGGMAAWRLGPKEVRIDVYKAPFADAPYYRNALRGLTVSLLSLFCTKAYMHERPSQRLPGSGTFRIQWV